MRKNFRNFASWKKQVEKQGLRAKKISVSKSHGEYWGALHRQRGIIGFFLTGPKRGQLEPTIQAAK